MKGIKGRRGKERKEHSRWKKDGIKGREGKKIEGGERERDLKQIQPLQERCKR